MDTVKNYDFRCIHCDSTNVFAVTNDGGSVQMCNVCKKTYKAKEVAAQQFFLRADRVVDRVGERANLKTSK